MQEFRYKELYIVLLGLVILTLLSSETQAQLVVVISSVYYWYFVLTSLLLFFLYIFLEEYIMWRKEWLSYLILKDWPSDKKIVKNNTTKIKSAKLSFFNLFDNTFATAGKFREDLKLYYLPSVASFTLIILLFLVIFFASHSIPYSNLTSLVKVFEYKSINNVISDNTYLNNMTAVLGGLSGIIFALIIFVVESIRDNKNYLQKRTLLKISNLWFLSTFTILSLINFLWLRNNVLSFIFPMVVSFLAIQAFWRIIRYLLSPSNQAESNLQFLKEKVNISIDESINERIGNNILFQQVGVEENKEIKLDYMPSKHWLGKAYGKDNFINGEGSGRIIDIHLGELKRLADYLEKKAKSKKFSIYDPNFLSLKTGSSASPSQSTDVRKVYLLKKYKEYLPPDDTIFYDEDKAILAVPTELMEDDEVVEHIQSRIPHIFKFDTKATPSNEIKKELGQIKDQLIEAIKGVLISRVEDLKEVYLLFAESFLERLHRFGGGFSPEQAKKERNSITGGWNELSWLRHDISELFPIAVNSNNKEIINDIGFLPVAISIRAIKARDHLLFQEFIGFTGYLYKLSSDLSGDIKEHVIDRSWRYLKEVTDFYIAPIIKDEESNSKNDYEDFGNFVVHVYKTFQDLIKSSFDRNDFDSFSIFLGKFDSLFKDIDEIELQYPRSEHLEHLLSNTEDPLEKEKLIKQIAEKKDLEKIQNQVKSQQKEVIFGISAHILEKYKNKATDELVKRFYDEISKYLPTDLIKLTQIYLDVHTFEREDSWGWDWWDLVMDGGVQHIDFKSKLDRLYVVQSLRILSGLEEEAIKTIQLPYNRDLVYLSADSGSLNKFLESIINDSLKWNFVLRPKAISRIDLFKELLAIAKQKQETEEENQVRNTQISEAKIVEFKTNLIKKFSEHTYLRKLITQLGTYTNKSSETYISEISLWGFNQIYDKEAFLDKWHVSYGDSGGHFGDGLAESENRFIYKEIADNILYTEKVLPNDVLDKIKDYIDKNQIENPIILGAFEPYLKRSSLMDHPNFINSWDPKSPNLGFAGIGIYAGCFDFNGKYIPLFNLNTNEERNTLCVFNMKELVELIQHPPIEKNEDKIDQHDILLVRIKDLNFDSETRNKILAQKPAWLEDKKSKEDYLGQRVLIHIFEKIEVKINKEKSAYKIIIADDKNEVV